MRVLDRAAVSALAGAAILGLGNLAYRLGEGGAVAIAAHRALFGALILAPFAIPAARKKGAIASVKNQDALIAIAISGGTLVVTAITLRTLTGPQAGLAIAVIPLVVLAVRRYFVQHRPAPLVPLAVCVTAAMAGTITGGLGEITALRAVLLVVFLVAYAAEVISMERARARTATSVLILGGMAAGALLGLLVAMFTSSGLHMSPAAMLAAVLVGIAGTTGRWLRGFALPQLGSAVTSSTSQISALITAAGGVFLFDDDLRLLGVACSLIAAVSALIALLSSRRAEIESPRSRRAKSR